MPWTLDDVLKELENQQTTAKTSNAKSGRWTVQDVEEALKPKPPVLSDREQLKSEMSIIRKTPEFKQYKTDIRTLDKPETEQSRVENIMKSPIGQFIAGAYEGSPIARTVSSMQKLSTGREPLAAQYARESAQYSSPYRTAGSLYSGLYEGLVTYGTVGKAVSGLPTLQKISSPFLRNVVGGQLADTLIQTPAVVMEGVSEKKPASKILKDIGKQQALDLAGNVLFGGLETGVNALNARKLIKQPLTGDASEFIVRKPQTSQLNIPDETVIRTTGDYVPPKTDFYVSPEGNVVKDIKDVPKLLPAGKSQAKKSSFDQFTREGYETLDGFVPPDEVFNGLDNMINKVEQNIAQRQVVPEFKVSNRETPFILTKEEFARIPKKAIPPSELVDILPNIKNLPRVSDNLTPKADLPKAATEVAATVDLPKRPIFTETPKGEIPAGMRERGFSRNVRTDYAMNDAIREALDEEPLAYKQISNKETQTKAEKIFSQGFESALENWYRNLSSFRPEDVPLARMLANQAADTGNIELSRKIIADVAEKLTQAGQFSQAARILRQSDPDSFLIYVQRQLNKLNTEGAAKYGKKWKDFSLTDDEIKLIRSMKSTDEAGREAIMEQIYDRIADQMPSTGMEKFNAWRRMAMLLNPKTHIRNLGGNVIMKGLRKTADNIGAMLEKTFLPQTQRTKSIGWSADSNLRKIVDESWNTVKSDVIGDTGRWDFKTFLGREKRTFKSDFLESLNKISGKSLNAEDVWFLEPAYKDALGQFMKARGINEVTDEAIQYATRRALEATYRDASWMASMINKAKAKGGVAGTLTEAIIPFTKTPINIAKRAYEYSPAGLIGDFIEHAAKRKDPVKLIERLSQGLTGTAITALGFGLAKMGLLSGQPEKSAKYEKFKQASGELPYSINLFGKDVTYDWAQPFAVPLAMGYEIYNSIKDDEELLKAVTDALMAGGDTIFNMSMLKNIRESIAGYTSPTQAMLNIATDYARQAIPTVGGQLARTIDPTIRTTYAPSSLESFGRYVLSRVPGASTLLEPKVDVWGREVKQGNVAQRALSNLVAPWLTPNSEPTEVDTELKRLFDVYNDTDLLPRVIPYNTYKKMGGETVRYNLKPKELTQLQKEVGQNTFKSLESLMSSGKYRSAKDDKKRSMIKSTIEKEWKPWEEFRLAKLKAEAEKRGIK